MGRHSPDKAPGTTAQQRGKLASLFKDPQHHRAEHRAEDPPSIQEINRRSNERRRKAT